MKKYQSSDQWLKQKRRDFKTFDERLEEKRAKNSSVADLNDQCSECPECGDCLTVDRHCDCCGYDEKLDLATKRFIAKKPYVEILGSSFDPHENLLIFGKRPLKQTNKFGIWHNSQLIFSGNTYDETIVKFREIERSGVDLRIDINQLHQIIEEHQQAYQKFTAQYPKYQVLRITYVKSLEKWLLLIEDKSPRKKSQNNYGVIWWDGKEITIITTGDISHSENHYFKLESFTRDIDIPKQNYSLPDLTPYRKDNRTYLRSGDEKLCEQYQLNFGV